MPILLFQNIHRVLQAEKKLQTASIPYELIPPPTAYSKECGMSIQIEAGYETAAKAALGDITYKSIKIGL
jgi:hypothetical protein